MTKYFIISTVFLLAFIYPKNKVLGQGLFNADTLAISNAGLLYLPDSFVNTASGKLYNKGTIEIRGNWQNNGQIKPTGTTRFNGNISQKMGGNRTSHFYDLILQNSASGDTAFLLYDSAFDVTNNAGLLDGIVRSVNGSKPTFLAAATASFASDSGHFACLVSKAGMDSFVFPVGNGKYYRPCIVTNITTVGIWTAGYFFSNPKIAVSSLLRANLRNISGYEYWQINANGTGRIRLSFDTATTSQGIYQPGSLVVAGANSVGSPWFNFKMQQRQGNGAKGTIKNDSAIGNGWHFFTFGTTSPANPLNIQTSILQGMEVQVFPNPTSDILNIKLPEIHNSIVVTLFDVSGRIIIQPAKIKESTQFSLAGVSEGTYFLNLQIGSSSTTFKIAVIH